MRETPIRRARFLSLVARFLTPIALLVAAWPTVAHGPMPPQEVEVAPGRILIKAREGVDLVGGFAALLPHSPQMAALNSEAEAFEARPLFPQYRREAMLMLEDRALRGLAAPSLELRAKMADLGRWIEITVDPAMDPIELARRYAALEEVEQAEPDYLMRLVEGDATAEVSGPRAHRRQRDIRRHGRRSGCRTTRIWVCSGASTSSTPRKPGSSSGARRPR